MVHVEVVVAAQEDAVALPDVDEEVSRAEVDLVAAVASRHGVEAVSAAGAVHRAAAVEGSGDGANDHAVQTCTSAPGFTGMYTIYPTWAV